MQTGNIRAICISEKKGTEKHAVDTAEINDKGILGDAHAGDWHRQVSLLSYDEVLKFKNANPQINIEDGAFGENILIEGIDLRNAKIGERVISGSVELEITQIGKECHGKGCTIFSAVGDCIMPRIGLFAKVISTGKIETGDSVEYYEQA